MSNPGNSIKFTMMVKRRSDMTEEEFHRYWTNDHTAVVDEWLAKHGVIRYVQYHTPSKERQQMVEVLQLPSGPNISDFDGAVELTAPSLEALKSAFSDPYYKSHVEPDEQKFFDAAKSLSMMGWEETKIEDNKILRES